MDTNNNKKGREGRDGRGGGRGGRGGMGRPAPSEYDHKILGIRRVTRVVAGGRRFSFSIAVVLGNKKGKVGLGVGKGGDISASIEKAVKDAKKHLITVQLTKTQSIPHEVYAKFSSSRVEIRPSPGRGMVAGSSVRMILELLGARDVSAKIFSKSKNKLNNGRATMKALETLAVK